MKILLVGEYSRLHNSLKEGLTKLDHEVTLMSSGDGFKNFPSDIKLKHSFQNFFLKKIRVIAYRLFGIDLQSIEVYLKAKKALRNLGEFDVIQLINESSIKVIPKYEIKFIKALQQHSKNIFVLACGEDYITSTHLLSGNERYSIMSPLLDNPKLKTIYKHQFSCVSPEHKKLHDYLFGVTNGVIASDMDYHIPYKNHPKYLGLIPNPVNIDKLNFNPINPKQFVVFHGVNKASEHKKGNAIFFEAIDLLKDQYKDSVEFITTYSIPYQQYIKIYDKCTVLLDQIYGYDQGYNALEAMAKGKIVFTGADKEWQEHYNIKANTVAINTLPDANYIAKELERLINNPELCLEISKNARHFIETKHHYVTIAQTYIDTWSAHNKKS